MQNLAITMPHHVRHGTSLANPNRARGSVIPHPITTTKAEDMSENSSAMDIAEQIQKECTADGMSFDDTYLPHATAIIQRALEAAKPDAGLGERVAKLEKVCDDFAKQAWENMSAEIRADMAKAGITTWEESKALFLDYVTSTQGTAVE